MAGASAVPQTDLDKVLSVFVHFKRMRERLSADRDNLPGDLADIMIVLLAEAVDLLGQVSTPGGGTIARVRIVEGGPGDGP